MTIHPKLKVSRASIGLRFGANFGVGAALGAGLMTGTAALSQVLVNPVVVELGAQHRAATVKVSLSDAAKAPMRLQAELRRWEQTIEGDDVVSPSNDLLVTPAIATIKPGETQLFRVAYRGIRVVLEEIAYRLILEDIAEPTPIQPDTATEGSIAVQFRMRYDLPVMVAPTGKVVNALRWRPCPTSLVATATSSTPTATNSACVRISNAGNRRVKVQTLTLAGDGWQQTLQLKEGVNVLVGAEREWRVALQPGQVDPVARAGLNGLKGPADVVRSVQVQTVRGETLQALAGEP